MLLGLWYLYGGGLMAKTVQEYLKEVDYQILQSYKPSQFAIEFVNFIKLVNGSTGEENETPIMHYIMLDRLVSPNPRSASMVFRGGAKTTVLGEYLFLYLAVFGSLPSIGKINVAMYVSDSMDNGVKNMRKNLEQRYNTSEYLQNYIPTIKFTDNRWEFINKEGKVFVIRAFGAKSGVRGFKELAVRPQLAVLDDLISDDDARSPTVIESVKATVHEAVTQALHPKRQKMIWLGTPFNANDPLYEAIESGAWEVSVFPIANKFPCSREEFYGAWSDRFTYDFIMDKYQTAVAQGRVAGFYQELMLQIMSEDERVILDSDIQWYALPNLLDKKDNFNFYITTDFATSEKESADYSFISVWAVNHKGFYFWVDGICAKQTMDKNIDDLFKFVMYYNPQSVGIEVSGQQAGFIAWIQREMFNRNVFFTLASNGSEGTFGLRPNGNKLERFNMVVPDFKLKRFYFPVDKKFSVPLKELLLELSQVTVGGFKSKHDDGLDTISQLAMMQIWLPSQEVKFSRENGIWHNSNEITQSSYMESYIV